ncbi:hypothetical protein L226DRAFT_538333 [Lentinus tigrinus ALCF2SS1-7]|uniref:uncharacterized protein n=1 Tax=Lentinus tigrinus ALCF2SS1-7 TaxID=1328758 RepID=UPI001166223C|nr:hypothetical protein L226DRAFT_538333 [Lentinus tigrinus ALCF2SS1-7]
MNPPFSTASQRSSTDPFAYLSLDLLDDVQKLIQLNADEESWTWSPGDREHWKPAQQAWQAFTSKWQDATEIGVLDEHNSLVLDISPIDRLFATAMPRILVRDCYQEAYAHVWYQALVFRDRGVIFTGEPGTGKSLFLWYLLVCLLQKRQVVLLNLESKSPLLFYHGRVYTAQSCSSLPETSCGFIWSLLDPHSGSSPPGSTDGPVFPVQASTPDEDLYREWRIRREALLTAFPLWSREEVDKGLRLQWGYPKFMERLRGLVENWPGQQPSETRCTLAFPYNGIRALLQKCCADQGVTSPSSAEDAFRFLLDAVIQHFGRAPRDVYFGLMDFTSLDISYREAQPWWCDQLRDIVTARAQYQRHLEAADYVICMVPESKVGEPVRWTFDFKSPVMARRVVELLVERESEDKIREMVSSFSSLPSGVNGKPLAKWFSRHSFDMNAVEVALYSIGDVDAPPLSSTSMKGGAVGRRTREMISL